jgi:hypothetical protein
VLWGGNHAGAITHAIHLQHPITGDSIFYDVMVTHPSRDVPAHSSRPLAAAELGYQKKMSHYAASYEGVRPQITPIVMDVCGGIAKGSWDELYRLLMLASNGGGEVDDQLFARFLQDLRYRLATSIEASRLAFAEAHQAVASQTQGSGSHEAEAAASQAGGPGTNAGDTGAQADSSGVLGGIRYEVGSQAASADDNE